MRIFAGPNGSGKSTIFREVSATFNIGIYLNPDDIELQLISTGYLDILEYGILLPLKISFEKYLAKSTLKEKAQKEGHPITVVLDATVFKTATSTINYEASLIADFLRENLIRQGKSLTFETVLSHKSKLDVMKLAIKNGYKNYLYFIGTESHLINFDRVTQRVKEGGHYVDQGKIESRYYSSMNLLKQAILHSYRAFIFDNSGTSANLILEVFRGKDITYHFDEVPSWVDKYFLRKKS